MHRISRAIVVLFAVTAFAQSPAPLTFEVADIKVSEPGGKETIQFLPGGKLVVQGMTLHDLVEGAWDVAHEYISGGPAFVNTERYDIVAKAPGSGSEKEVREMMKNMLLDRFKLQVHTEKKPMPVYALVVSKKGQKLKATEAGTKQECKLQLPKDRTDGQPYRSYQCKATTMKELAELLPNVAPAYADLPVVDLTDLGGAYDFTLEWTPRAGQRARAQAQSAAQTGSAIPQTSEPEGKTLHDSLQSELGLKLEDRKMPRDILVIDSVERVPTEK